ncbi:MAG: methyltransferase domain-containing protein [Thermoleophilia bacterium]
MATTVQAERAETWPLAQRAVTALARPGGAEMTERVIEGLGLQEGDRVVELAPGFGLTGAIVLGRGPRTWTAVDPDPLAVEHLAALAAPAGREAVVAPVDETGLPEASATVVMADALLTVLDDGGRRAVIAEAVRLLRAGGRVAFHDLAPGPALDGEARADLAACGIRPLTTDELRALVEDAGLVVLGTLEGALRLPAQRDLMREAGPRLALRITRELALKGGLRQASLSARQALERRELSLRSAIVVAEKPLVLGFRRPRP